MSVESIKLEPIRINAAEELLKAFEIVHGPGTAYAYRRILWAVIDRGIAQAENCGGAGI